MPSAKPKGNKSGPYGYFQRVLMDAARPFSYRAQTNRLLGQTTTPPVQQLNASQFSQTTFPYAVNDNLPDANGRVIDLASPELVQAGVCRIEPALNSTLQTAAQHSDSPVAPAEITARENSRKNMNSEDTTTEDMTVLSWLDRAHASHSSLIPEATATPSITGGKQDLPYLSPVAKQPAANKHDLPENSAVLSDIKKAHRPQQATPAEGAVSSPGPVNPSRSIDINRPGKPTDPIIRRLYSGDSAMPASQSQTRPVPASSAGNRTENNPGVNRTQAATPQDAAILPAGPAENIHSLYPRRRQVAKVETQLSPDAMTTALSVVTKARQRAPQSKPLSRPNVPVPAPGMPKLQTAVKTRPVNTGTQPQGQRVEGQAHDAATSASAKAPPPAQQQVFVINQSAQSFSNRPAFWERRYLGRLGPRSYR